MFGFLANCARSSIASRTYAHSSIDQRIGYECRALWLRAVDRVCRRILNLFLSETLDKIFTQETVCIGYSNNRIATFRRMICCIDNGALEEVRYTFSTVPMATRNFYKIQCVFFL